MLRPAPSLAIFAFPVLPSPSHASPGSTLDSDYLELAPGPHSRRGGRFGDASDVGIAGDAGDAGGETRASGGDIEDNEEEDPLYASWKR